MGKFTRYGTQYWTEIGIERNYLCKKIRSNQYDLLRRISGVWRTSGLSENPDYPEYTVYKFMGQNNLVNL